MPELTSEDRKDGLDFANRLTLLAAEAPNLFCEKLVHRIVNQIRIKHGYSTRLKKQEILKICKERGGVSIADLVELTGWHRDEIFDMARELETEKRVKFDRVPANGGKGGRPAVLIFALETRSFAPPPAITAR